MNFDECVCDTRPLSEGSGLGLNYSEVPQSQVSAVVGLFVSVHFYGHGPLPQKLHKVIRHGRSQLLQR